MNEFLPNAKSIQVPGEREKLQRIIAQRSLGGLANDTKWDELLLVMRTRTEWRPGYRFKCVDGMPSRWDVEWFYHLPFPFMAVEWFDIGRLQEVTIHRLPRRIEIVDHGAWIEPLLQKIGFDYRMGTEMFRIFGYAPRNLDLFDEWGNSDNEPT